MSRSKSRRRARSKALKKLEQQSVDDNNANLEASSNEQNPSDAKTTMDTLMQVDSTEHQIRDDVSTTATVSCENALLGVESAANLLSTKPQELDENPMENRLETNVAGKKKKRRRKKRSKRTCSAATTDLQDTLLKAESAVQLPAPELQDIDMNLVNNLEVKSANGKRKKRKKKNRNKPTNNVLDVDSSAKLLAPEHQERDTDLTKDIEEKSESGQKSSSRKKKRKKNNLANPASNVIDAESTAEVLVPEHQDKATSSTKDLDEKNANERKRKRGDNIVEPTSDAQRVELTAQQLSPEKQEKKKKKKRRKAKKAASNNIDDVKIATQDSLSSKGTRLPSGAEVTMHAGPHLRRKLLILDLNGLLADIVMPPPKGYKADACLSRRAIFKRPFCDEFLKFCFERFNVGIWSSRTKKIIDRVVDYLLGDLKHKLLFCWDMSHSTTTTFKTLENKHKPLVCKDLRKIWENHYPGLPWEKGDFDESNTLLLDDSPYKALLNPVHSTIFPVSYNFMVKDDNSLGPGGDLRVYLEKLVDAEHVQKYVEQHPFGQSAIDEKSSNWDFYSKVIRSISCSNQANYGDPGTSKKSALASCGVP